MYLLSTICLTLLLYVILKGLCRCYRHFCRYHCTLHFHCVHGHDRGPLTVIAIEFNNLLEIVNVHIAQVKLPFRLLSVHDANHHDYHVVSGNWLYDFLKLFKPIFIIPRDCTKHICMPITFELGWFQHVKNRRIVNGEYLARIIAFQNDTMIPLSHIQVCNHSLPIASGGLSVTTTASCPLPAVTSSRPYPSHALYKQAEPDHNVPTSDFTVTLNTPTVTIQTPLDSTVVTHLNGNDIWTP